MIIIMLYRYLFFLISETNFLKLETCCPTKKTLFWQVSCHHKFISQLLLLLLLVLPVPNLPLHLINNKILWAPSKSFTVCSQRKNENFKSKRKSLNWPFKFIVINLLWCYWGLGFVLSALFGIFIIVSRKLFNSLRVGDKYIVAKFFYI